MAIIIFFSVVVFMFCLSPLQLMYAYSTVDVKKGVKCRSLGYSVITNRRTGKKIGVAKLMYQGKPYTFSFDMKDIDKIDCQPFLTVDVVHFNCHRLLTPGCELNEFWLEYTKEKLNKRIRRVAINSVLFYLVLQIMLVLIYFDATGGAR